MTLSPQRAVLSSQPIVGFIGPLGVGKTEVAMGYASASAEAGRRTAIVDLDIVTPYFRVGDYRQPLSRRGVEVIAQHGYLNAFDSPAISSDVAEALAGDRAYVVLDVGGDAEGARLLGVYADRIAARGYALLLVCNPFRPDVSARTYSEQRLAIERASGLHVTGLVANPHLGPETQLAHIAQGHADVTRLAKDLDLTVAFMAVDERLAAQAASLSVPVLALHLGVRLPWDSEPKAGPDPTAPK